MRFAFRTPSVCSAMLTSVASRNFESEEMLRRQRPLVRRRYSKRDGSTVIEAGGKDLSCEPSDVFGASPIVSSSVPPFATSLCSIQRRSSALPFQRTLCTYLLSREEVGAAITNSLPFFRWIVTFVNTGLVTTFRGTPGITG